MLSCPYDSPMDDKKYPSHTLDKFQLRFPEGMRDQVKAAADQSGRSMNAEIIERLKESFVGAPVSEEALVAPDKARLIAQTARDQLAITTRRFAIRTLNEAIASGKTKEFIDFTKHADFEEGDGRAEGIIDPIIEEIETSGYSVELFDSLVYIVSAE